MSPREQLNHIADGDFEWCPACDGSDRHCHLCDGEGIVHCENDEQAQLHAGRLSQPMKEMAA